MPSKTFAKPLSKKEHRMAEFVEKWVIGFDWSNKLQIAKAKFRKTPKRYILVKGDDTGVVEAILRIHTPTYDHSTNKLYDTRKAALDAFSALQKGNIEASKRRILGAEITLAEIEALRNAE